MLTVNKVFFMEARDLTMSTVANVDIRSRSRKGVPSIVVVCFHLRYSKAKSGFFNTASRAQTVKHPRSYHMGTD